MTMNGKNTLAVTGPLAGTELWLVVIAAACGVCQCAGGCGTKHRDGRNTPCSVAHGERSSRGPVRLIAAPVDPSISAVEAAQLGAERLRAWCPTCFSGAVAAGRKRAREAARPQEDSLF
jgi:hypothetical protein